MHVLFDLASLYYWPQYAPVFDELVQRGHDCGIAAYRAEHNADLVTAFFESHGKELPFTYVDDNSALGFYQSQRPDWIIFGHGNFKALKLLPSTTRTALLNHGIGVKAGYYADTLMHFDARFTEGSHRHNQLQMMYPNANLQQVGFAKLDPLFSTHPDVPGDKATEGCSKSKATLLYAPTFYPSSIERMPMDWPSALAEYNIIIKPHFFTFSGAKYARQRTRLKHWESFDNVQLAPAEAISLVPYMREADLLISDASSALFEFAALDRPILWLDFVKLRWTYKGPFRYRLRRRMDGTADPYRNVALHVASPDQLVAAVRNQLACPAARAAERARVVEDLIGTLDGKVSIRVVDYLESLSRKMA